MIRHVLNKPTADPDYLNQWLPMYRAGLRYIFGSQFTTYSSHQLCHQCFSLCFPPPLWLLSCQSLSCILQAHFWFQDSTHLHQSYHLYLLIHLSPDCCFFYSLSSSQSRLVSIIAPEFLFMFFVLCLVLDEIRLRLTQQQEIRDLAAPQHPRSSYYGYRMVFYYSWWF